MFQQVFLNSLPWKHPKFFKNLHCFAVLFFFRTLDFWFLPEWQRSKTDPPKKHNTITLKVAKKINVYMIHYTPMYAYIHTFIHTFGSMGSMDHSYILLNQSDVFAKPNANQLKVWKKICIIPWLDLHWVSQNLIKSDDFVKHNANQVKGWCIKIHWNMANP